MPPRHTGSANRATSRASWCWRSADLASNPLGRIALRSALGIGAPGTLAVAADLAGAPQPGSVRARIDEEPATARRLAAAQMSRVLGGEQRSQRPENRP